MSVRAEHSTGETHRFVSNRWAARRAAAAMMVVLYAIILWIVLGKESDLSSWFEFTIISFIAALALVFLIISRHPITRLRVGPDGVSVPFGILRQVAWHEIQDAHYILKRPLILPPREWMHLTLKPKGTTISRVPLPAGVQNWLRRVGIWIPLHLLRDPSGEILSSIERFMPVTESDLDPQPSERPGFRRFLPKAR